MTMNLWILASVLVGGGVGYFLFRPWSFTKKVKNGNGNIIQVRETTKPLLAKESFV
jgi:prolipoprotein diacylglyceryltransferase